MDTWPATFVAIPGSSRRHPKSARSASTAFGRSDTPDISHQLPRAPGCQTLRCRGTLRVRYDPPPPRPNADNATDGNLKLQSSDRSIRCLVCSDNLGLRILRQPAHHWTLTAEDVGHPLIGIGPLDRGLALFTGNDHERFSPKGLAFHALVGGFGQSHGRSRISATRRSAIFTTCAGRG